MGRPQSHRTGILVKGKLGHRNRSAHGEIEAEIGEMLLQAKECHWLLTSQQELWERRGRILPPASAGASPAHRPIAASGLQR